MNYRLAFLPLSLGLLLSVAGVARPAAGTVTAAGPAKDVVPCPTCAERLPAIAGTRAGKVLAGWEGSTSSESAALRARFFVAPGQPSGALFGLNPATEFLRERALALAGTPAGGFLAAYEVLDAAGDSDIWVRRFNPKGAPLGAAIQVNIEDLTLGSSDTLPAIGVGPDGSFLVVWLSSPAPPGPFDRLVAVMARRFNAAGAAAQLPTVVNTSLADTRPPAACIDSSGRGIVSWTTADEIRIFQASKNGVAFRRFGAGGLALDAGERTVAKPLAALSHVALSCGLARRFVVAWSTDQAPAAPGQGIVAARYNQNGNRQGPVFSIAGDAERPAVSHDTLGNFVVVWDNQSGVVSAILGRRYLASGAADGAAFPIAQSPSTGATRTLRAAKVAHFGSAKSFVVAWDSGLRNALLRFFKAQ